MDTYTSCLEEAIHVLLKKLLRDLKLAADVAFQDNLRTATMKASRIYAKQKSPALLARCLQQELKGQGLRSVTVRKGPDVDFTFNKLRLVASRCQGDMNKKKKDAQAKDMDAAREKEGKENKRPKKRRPRPNP